MTGRMCISVDMDELAIALVTSTKTRTGATPLRAVTKISPRMPTSLAPAGHTKASAAPRTSATRICRMSEP